MMNKTNSICLDTADHPDLAAMKPGDTFKLTATYTVTENDGGSLYANVGPDAEVESAEPTADSEEAGAPGEGAAGGEMMGGMAGMEPPKKKGRPSLAEKAMYS